MRVATKWNRNTMGILAVMSTVSLGGSAGPPRAAAVPKAPPPPAQVVPLNGAWASAPYLHNGSVPTLYDLPRPASARPKKFAVGRWQYEPKKVGYVSDGDAPWVYDTSATGNHNGGHEYGTSLSEDGRWALVEYLKTL